MYSPFTYPIYPAATTYPFIKNTLLSSSDKRSVSHHVSNSLDTWSCLLSLTALISNIIRIHFGISCGNADGIFVGEKCEHFFRLNVCIGFRVSSTFGQSDGCMSDTPETMGGLSGVPNGTSSQTSASRGYVLFRGANKGHTQKSYKLSSGMRTWPAECSKLGKTRIIEDANIRLVRNATFFEPNFQMHSLRNR